MADEVVETSSRPEHVTIIKDSGRSGMGGMMIALIALVVIVVLSLALDLIWKSRRVATERQPDESTGL